MTNPIWFCATRGRPNEMRDCIAAFRACDRLPDVAVTIDGQDQWEAYEGVDWPNCWNVHYSSEHSEMTFALNALLSTYRDRPSYGWFADHFRPLTPMWRDLSAAAGDWFIAWPADGYMSTYELCGVPTFGAKLVREMGWLCLPNTVHIATEAPWMFLWQKLGIVKHVAQHKFSRTWPNKRQGIVPRSFKDADYNAADITAARRWRAGEGLEVVDRIRSKMIDDGYEFLSNGLIHPKHGCVPYGQTTSHEQTGALVSLIC